MGGSQVIGGGGRRGVVVIIVAVLVGVGVLGVGVSVGVRGRHSASGLCGGLFGVESVAVVQPESVDGSGPRDRSVVAVDPTVGVEVAGVVAATEPSSDELEHAATVLGDNIDDPGVLTALFVQLSPSVLLDGVARLDDTDTDADISLVRSELVGQLGVALANASVLGVLPVDYASGLVGAVAGSDSADQRRRGGALNELMRSGSYDGVFVNDMAIGILEVEADTGHQVARRGGWFGRGSAEGCADPMIGLLHAISNNGDAADRFLYPDNANTGEQRRLALVERDWVDNYHQLARVFETVAVPGDANTDDVGQTAAQAATDSVILLGPHLRSLRSDGDAVLDPVGSGFYAARTAMANILAAYIEDVDLALTKDHGNPAVRAQSRFNPDRPGAAFNEPQAAQVLLGIMDVNDFSFKGTTPSPTAIVLTAAVALNNTRLNLAIDGPKHSGTHVNYKGAISSNLKLMGFVTRSVTLPNEQAEQPNDENTDAMLGFIQTASSTVAGPDIGVATSNLVAGATATLGTNAVIDTVFELWEPRSDDTADQDTPDVAASVIQSTLGQAARTLFLSETPLEWVEIDRTPYPDARPYLTESGELLGPDSEEYTIGVEDDLIVDVLSRNHLTLDEGTADTYALSKSGPFYAGEVSMEVHA